MNELEGFLHQLCDVAAVETLPRFRTGLDVTNKLEAGFDPVTEGDREAERVIRELIGQHYPDHGIIGEEMGVTNQDAEFVWIIDPIDGTRAFISGIPVWGTLIALAQSGRCIAGIMHQPFTGERFWAVSGKSYVKRDGSHQTHRLQTRATANVADAIMMTTSPRIFSADEQPIYDRFEHSCRMARYGCDCYAYAMIASGNIDLVVESGLNTYDIAALIPIVETAGGVVTTWQGKPALDGGRILAAANPHLHAEALELLNS